MSWAFTVPRVVVCLTIKSDNFDPEEITHYLGITPTDSWKVGDPQGKNNEKRKDTLLLDRGSDP